MPCWLEKAKISRQAIVLVPSLTSHLWMGCQPGRKRPIDWTLLREIFFFTKRDRKMCVGVLCWMDGSFFFFSTPEKFVREKWPLDAVSAGCEWGKYFLNRKVNVWFLLPLSCRYFPPFGVFDYRDYCKRSFCYWALDPWAIVRLTSCNLWKFRLVRCRTIRKRPSNTLSSRVNLTCEEERKEKKSPHELEWNESKGNR